ncbi:hypothetical protein PG984_016464 [Apiospora sp. TS-2023a]
MSHLNGAGRPNLDNTKHHISELEKCANVNKREWYRNVGQVFDFEGDSLRIEKGKIVKYPNPRMTSDPNANKQPQVVDHLRQAKESGVLEPLPNNPANSENRVTKETLRDLTTQLQDLQKLFDIQAREKANLSDQSKMIKSEHAPYHLLTSETDPFGTHSSMTASPKTTNASSLQRNT